MEFVSGFLSGLGWSLGFCVGGVAWMLLKEAVHRILGHADLLDENRQFSMDTLQALLERNLLTETTNEHLGCIAAALGTDEVDP